MRARVGKESALSVYTKLTLESWCIINSFSEFILAYANHGPKRGSLLK